MALASGARMHASPSLSLSVSPLAVSVAGRVGHAFAPPAMLKGFECHTRGVELLDTSRDHVRARVRGPRPQEVDLTVDRGRLLIKCTCPSESMTPDPCRHAWAALLEIDRQGLLDDLREKRGPARVDTTRDEPAPARPAKKKAAAKKKRSKAR
ncbi:MAG: SWIM zinc finger family protein [Labilithrix sp.]|nr:SWIM zinc finger family protein [Labilithrix sp.]MCW5814537.1 SWIM zinc finger family protein [Labilithrix sp.]